MQWRTGDPEKWHPVPFALIPVCFECVVYWLERPPWEQRVKFFSEAGPHYEYRKAAGGRQ